MIWSAARLFHGRRISWPGMFAGAGAWLAASSVPDIANSSGYRVIVSSLIVATYTFMIAVELWRERRKPLIRRWPAIFVPMLHGAIFLFPMALASLSFDLDGSRNPATGWAAVFAMEVVLYVVGAAFIVLVLAKDRAVRAYKVAAATDVLTGLLNRRGFFESAADVVSASRSSKRLVSVLAFDLDHFKSINDNFGHAMGDTMLQLFACVARKTMRSTDVIGRLGGEEFVAVLSGTQAEAGIAAERVRAAFEAATLDPKSNGVQATVSIGVASGPADTAIDQLITRADAALYRAKANGRNRIECADGAQAALRPVAPVVSLQTVRERLTKSLSEQPQPAPIVVRRGS
jgi:diguanylate cyclase (GGDEF)-like protein